MDKIKNLDFSHRIKIDLTNDPEDKSSEGNATKLNKNTITKNKLSHAAIINSKNNKTETNPLSKTSRKPSTSISTCKKPAFKYEEMLSLCPNNIGSLSCSGCTFEGRGDNLLLKCHCGSPAVVMLKRRKASAVDHWNSTTQLPFTSFFSKRPADWTPPPQPEKQPVITVPCSGLTDKSWPRDSDFRIIDCICSSPNIYHGGPPCHVVCKELFASTSEKDLDKEQRLLLAPTLQIKATWMIKRHEGIEAIHSTSCLREVPEQKGVDLVVCKECDDVRQDSSLRVAIKKATKVEDNQLFWSKFANHAQNGAFDNMVAFKGLVKAVSVRMERESNGKSLTGRHFEPAFDDFSPTLAAISPQGYRLFMETYAGRTTQSQRDIRSKLGLKLVDGLAIENFERIFNNLQKLN
ncbi:hypothetical protein DFH28DRAFT_1187084 [Melampsora americana]|nr:hypothetical protein DFH28DRAFT_1187084 [Melampsora americana]